MNNPRKQFELYLDGQLDAAELTEFERWIQDDPSHAVKFLQWAALEGQIADLLRLQRYQQVVQADGAKGVIQELFAPQQIEQPSVDRGPTKRPNLFRLPLRWQVGWLQLVGGGLAALLVLGLLFSWGAMLTGDQRAAPRTIAETNASSTPDSTISTTPFSSQAAAPHSENVASDDFAVATLTALVEPEWTDSGNVFRQGQELPPGTVVSLQQGLAKVAFESGAEVVLQAPFSFVVEDPMHGRLSYGNLSARVPRRASGFIVESAVAQVVDLGTEFGFSVTKDGQSEVHVFSGEVLSRKLEAQGQPQGELIRLNQQDALRFEVDGEIPVRITADERKFVRNASRELSPEQTAPLASQRDLALWLAADFSVDRDPEGRVVAWRDAICGDNTSAEDALQVLDEARPTFVPDAINGRPAIRFDGKKTFLVTTPLATTDNQTVLLVCQFNRGAVAKANRPGGQILNYNGPPHRLLSTTYEPGVLQIGEPILDDFAPTRIRAKVYAGELGGAGVSEGRLIAPAVAAERPVVVSYTYNNKANRSELAIDGRSQGVGTARSPAGVVSRKVLGRHGFDSLFFHGDLAEVLIFNRALDPDELRDVTQYLGDKYEVEIHGH